MRHKQTNHGFTLIELLVVISIIGVLAGITFPVLRKMSESTNITTASNTVSSAVAGARAYATREIYFLEDLEPSRPGSQSSDSMGDGYSGAAALFTPMNEIRIVENIQKAYSTSGHPLELPDTSAPAPYPIRNGYADVDDFDYVRLPSRIGVLGLAYISGELNLVPPPFAISFNRSGSLVLRQDLASSSINNRGEGWVYYDADRDGEFDTSSDRSSAGNYEDYALGNDSLAATDGRYDLPFEKIDTVVGVVLYVKKDFQGAGHSIGDFNPIPDDGSNDALFAWLLDYNGTVLFFNRYTGARAN